MGLLRSGAEVMVVAYKSKSQHRLMRVLEAQGEVDEGTARRWYHETPDPKALPEYVTGRDAKKKATSKGKKLKAWASNR